MTIDADTIRKLAEGLTATPRLQDGAALAGTGLLLPLARLHARSARRELTRVRLREGDKSEAAKRQLVRSVALVAREREIADHFARRAGPQAELGEGEAGVSGRVTRDGEALVDAEVVALNARRESIRRTCTGRDGRYALALPADTDLRLEVREEGKARYRDEHPTAYPRGYRGARDIEIGKADPVCDPAAPGDPAVEVLQMPSLVGLALELAVRTVEALGLRLVQVAEERSDRPGIVIAQKPPAGARVAPGSEVALTVGRDDDRPAANVGDLRGKTLNDALKAMADREVGLASVTIGAGKGRTPVVRGTRLAEAGNAIHLAVTVGGDKAAEVDVAATLIGASPEGLAIGLGSAAEAGRWLAEAKIGSLADLVEAAGEDDAALRKRLSLEPRAKVSGPRRALLAAASRISRD